MRRNKPVTKKSYGEKVVARFLRRKKIKFRTEKEFPWLKNGDGNNLRFDFWLPDYNAAIEFDGIFHYTSKRQKYNDRHKNACCKRAGVRLLRIPYWEINKVSKLILDFLSSPG